ncbi:hypothetical protein BH20VER1_BH20VER1_27300 [soil metagenome]
MNSTGHLPVSDATVRPAGKGKRRGRPRKVTIASVAPAPREQPAVGTLTRTKSLLLAALRVWELKQRGLG